MSSSDKKILKLPLSDQYADIITCKSNKY